MQFPSLRAPALAPLVILLADAAVIGFEPIDTSRNGLYGDPAWVEAPEKVRRAGYKPPASPSR
jgi:hypothetical protein